MSMFRSASRAISTVFDTISSTANTVEKSLDIANHYVAENHKKITKTTTTSAQLAVARYNTDIAKELDADAELKEQYLLVAKEW